MTEKFTHDPTFANRLLTWFYQHGRHQLPWQQLHTDTPNPYPVWISEIMLQQTQVATVIGYFERFMTRFPTLESLATAPLDDVLSHWAGLGYYARARNLHKAAITLFDIVTHQGSYPQTLEAWQALSGIGRSTAGAIMAMGLGQFGVICDGNVKRVLTRHFGIDDDITLASTDKTLWALAIALTPHQHSNHYAQAMMDLGATVCTRTRPNCTTCPIHTTCVALKQNNVSAYPIKRKKSPKPTYDSLAIALTWQNKMLWLKRASEGIWGGLWCLPLYSHTDNPSLAPSLSEHSVFEHLPNDADLLKLPTLSTIRHTLTHFHWQLKLIQYPLDDKHAHHLTNALNASGAEFAWLDAYDAQTLSLPVAMKKLAPWHAPIRT